LAHYPSPFVTASSSVDTQRAVSEKKAVVAGRAYFLPATAVAHRKTPDSCRRWKGLSLGGPAWHRCRSRQVLAAAQDFGGIHQDPVGIHQDSGGIHRDPGGIHRDPGDIHHQAADQVRLACAWDTQAEAGTDRHMGPGHEAHQVRPACALDTQAEAGNDRHSGPRVEDSSQPHFWGSTSPRPASQQSDRWCQAACYAACVSQSVSSSLSSPCCSHRKRTRKDPPQRSRKARRRSQTRLSTSRGCCQS